jgi:hypothetical protein
VNSNLCPTCKDAINKSYCENCGEKQLNKKDLTFSHFLGQLFSTITDVDNKFLKSYSILIRKPGQLSLDYFNGIRKSRLNPVQVFLFANIVYFFLATFIQQYTFDTPLSIHLSANNFIHKELANELVNKRLKSSGELLASYEKRFNKKTESHSKALIFIIIPIFSLFVFLANIFPKQHYLTLKSLVYSSHLLSFILVFLIVQYFINASLIYLFLNLFEIDLSPYLLSEFALTLISFLSIWLYLFISVGRLFKNSTILIQFLKSTVLIFTFNLALLIYKMILFFTVYYSLRDQYPFV